MESPHAASQRLQPPVMCAVDASEEAEAVVRAGARIAALMDAPLVLFHVARDGSRFHGLDRLLHPDRQASDRDAGRALLERRAAAVPVAATLEMSAGVPTEEVLLAADDMDPALLVLGSRSSGALDALLGSVSRDVVRQSCRPTVVVPAGADPEFEGRTVVCGVDVSDASERAAGVGAHLASAFGGQLVLLGVQDLVPTGVSTVPGVMPGIWDAPDVANEQEHALRERAEGLAEDLSGIAPTRVMIDVGDPATRLSVAADELDAALIAVGTAHRAPLAGALTGSVSSALIGDAAHPVVVVP